MNGPYTAKEVQDILSSIDKICEDPSRFVKTIHCDSVKDLDYNLTKYDYKIDAYTTGEKTWNYTKLTIINSETEEEVMHLNRNYHSLEFMFVSKNGKDYIISGFDYQGISVMNLTDKTVKHYLPSRARLGAAFCITYFNDYDIEKDILKVEGCYWGGDYELREYKFDLEHPVLEEYNCIYSEIED